MRLLTRKGRFVIYQFRRGHDGMPCLVRIVPEKVEDGAQQD